MPMMDFPDRFTYKHVTVADTPETDITASFNTCFSFIDEARRAGGCVLVHCMAGVSRSATVVMGYLMKSQGMTFDAAFKHVKQCRPCICPNDGFRKQLQSYEKSLHLHAEQQ